MFKTNFSFGSIETLRETGGEFVGNKVLVDDRGAWIAAALEHFGYEHLDRDDKGLVRKFMQQATGYSRAQIARFIAQHQSKKFTTHAARESLTLQKVRRGAMGMALACMILLLSRSSGVGSAADLLKVINAERTQITRTDLHEAALRDVSERYIVVSSIHELPNGEVKTYPLIMVNEKTVVAADGTIARETIVSTSPEAMWARVEERRLARLRLLQIIGTQPTLKPASADAPARTASRPDVLIEKEMFPANTGLHAAAYNGPWDLPEGGKEGQIIMIDGGKLVWRDFPFLEQIRSQAPHGSEATRRAGGNRSGGNGGSTSTTTTTIIQQTGGDSAPSGWTDGSGIVYLTALTDNVGIGTDSTSNKLEVIGSISGASLYITDSMSGAGLTDCDGVTNKLVYDSTTGRFSCAIDQTVGTGLSIETGDERYVRKSGDTMTGALTINVTGGTNSTIGLNVLNTISGAVIRAQKSLNSSGTLVVEGAMSGASLYVATSLQGAGLVDCDIAGTSKLLWDASTGRFSCGTDTDTNTTYTAGRGLALNGTAFSLNTTITGALVRFDTISGSLIKANTTLASSGTLVVEGAMSGASLYIATSLQGAGLTDCDAANQTLAWDASTGRFSCSTDSDTTYTAGQNLALNGTAFSLNTTITGALVRFNTVSGSLLYARTTLASSGTLVVEGAMSGASLYVATSLNGAGLVDCDIAGTSKLLWDSGTGRFSCGTDADTDTNTTYTAGNNLTLNGTSFSLNSTITGALVRFNTISGSLVKANSTLASSGTLVVEGAMSGASLYIATSLQGAGLTDCDAANQTLAWDASTGRFSCGTDSDTTYTAGEGLTLNGTSFSLSDTISGALLEFSTVSGSTVYASSALRSSGSLTVEGAMSGASLYVATSLNGAGLVDCDIAGTSKLLWDASTGRFSCGTDQNAAASYTAGQGLTLNGSAFSLSSTITGALVRFDTISGSLIKANTTLASSGTLVVEGAMSGASLYVATSIRGAGLADCDLSTQALKWDETSGRFSCGAVSSNNFGSGNVLTLGDDRYVRTAGDTMTGALVIDIQGGNLSSIGLNVINTISGAVIRAQKTLASSGTLVVEGAMSGASLYIATSLQGAGLVDCDIAGTSKLLWDASTGRFSCGTDQNSENTYTAGQGLTLNGSAFSLNTTITGSLVRFLTVSGSVVKAGNSLASSGSLVWEGAASGASLYIATSLQGAGLTDCDAAGQTLNWDATTGRFSCGTDESAGSGLDLNTADERYVNTFGDTMTGALTINIQSGNLSSIGLNVINTISGAVIRAQKTLASSGTLVVEGAMSGASLYVATSLNGAGLVDCDIAGTSKLLWDSGTGRFSCGTDADTDTNTTYTAGNNLTLNGTSFSLNSTITGALVRFNTISGSLVKANTTLASSGTLVVEGAMSGASLYVATSIRGAGLADCDLSTQALKWDETSGRFSCGAVSTNSFGTGNVLTIADDRYVNISGDTMTGALAINVTGGNVNTVGLNVLNTISGAVIRAQKSLASSGTLAVEGAATIGGMLHVLQSNGEVRLDTGGAGNTFTLSFYDGTQRASITNNQAAATFTISTENSFVLQSSDYVALSGPNYVNVNNFATFTSSRLGLGTASPDTLLEVIGTASGTVVYGSESLRSSGSLVVEGTMSGASLYVATSINGAGLTDCDAAGQTLNWDASTGRFSCGTDADSDTTYTAGEGLSLNGTSFSLSDTISGALLEFGTVSGSLVWGNTLRSSGSLVVEGAMSGASLYVATSIRGAGLTDCDAASSKLLWDTTTGRFSCGTISSSSFGSGNVLTIGDARYVNVSGDTMTGALTIQNGNTHSATSTPLLNVRGTMSGRSLFVMGTGTKPLLITDAVNGRVGIGTDTPSALFHVTVSDDTTTPCQTLCTGTLLSLAADFNMGYKFTPNTNGYITKLWHRVSDSSAHTVRLYNMGGTVLASASIVGVSGTWVSANITPVSVTSGTSYVVAVRTNNYTYESFSFPVTVGDITIDENRYDSATNNIPTTSDNLNMYGQADITFSTTADSTPEFVVTSAGRVGIGTTTPDASLEVIGTASGTTIFANSALRSSGSIVAEGAISGATLFIGTSIRGSGLTDCDAASSKLLWDTTSGRFSCGTITATSSFNSGQVLTIADARYVRKSGDTMTGQLVINVTGGNTNTLGLNVINSISGAVIRAQKTLASSGTLVVEGAMSGASLYVATSLRGAGLTDCDAAGQTLNWDETTGRFSCGTDESAGSGLDLNSADARYVNVAGDTMTGVLVLTYNNTYTGGILLNVRGGMSGRTLNVSRDTTMSGTLIVDGTSDFNGLVNLNGSVNIGDNGVDNVTINGTTTMNGRILGSGGTLVIKATISGSALNIEGTSTLKGGVTLGDNGVDTVVLNGTTYLYGRIFGSGGSVIVKDAISGSSINLTGGATVNGFTTLNGGVTLGDNGVDNVTINGTTTMNGRILGSGGTLVIKATISGSALSIDGTTQLKGATTIIGDNGADAVTINGTTTLNGRLLGSGGIIYARATISGSGLHVDGASTFHGNVTLGNQGSDTVTVLSSFSSGGFIRFRSTVSGSYLKADRDISASGSLVVEGTMSGAFLYVGTSIRGAGLSDCDNGTTSKLLWDETTGRFSCGTDQGGGSGLSQSSGDERYVKKSGDTMTGGLLIQNGGTPGTIDANTLLEVVGVMSGSRLRIYNSATSTGTYIHQTGNGTALDILSRSTTADILNINAPLLTTGIGLDINGANALTTGQLVRLISNSSSTAVRSLMSIVNDHSSASNTTVFRLQQDSSGLGMFVDMNGNGIAVDIDSEATTQPGMRIDMPSLNANQNPHILFGYKGTFDANLFRSGPNQLTTSGSFAIAPYAFDSVYQDLDDDTASVSSDITAEAATSSGAVFTIFAVENPSNDYFYVGSVKPFTTVTFVLGRTAAGVSLNAEYWNGSSWSGLSLVDDTNNLTTDGSIRFEAPTNWLTQTINAEFTAKYYVRFHAGGGNVTRSPTAYSATPTIMSRFEVRSQKDDLRPLLYLNGRQNIGINTATPYKNAALTVSGGVLIAPGKNNPVLKPGLALEVMGAMSGRSLHISGTGSGPLFAMNVSRGAVGIGTGVGLFAKQTIFTDNNFNQDALLIKSKETTSTVNMFRIITDVGGANNTVFRVTASGGVFSDAPYNSAGADYAEWFRVSGTVDKGEVVCIDPTKQNTVKKCDRDADSNLMGIVSTNPAFIGNSISGADGIIPPGYALIGLIGQVPTKVMIENNEPIRPGDQLTAASIPGYARRARAGESTVGVALEGLASGQGTVNVLISRRNSSLTVEAVEEKVLQTVAKMEIEDEVELMVAGALQDLNVDDQISAEVERQIAAISNQAQSIEDLRAEVDLMKGEIALLKSQSGTVTRVESEESSGALITRNSHLAAASLELDTTLTTGGDARVGGDLYIDGALNASSLFVPNGLTVDGGMVMNGLLDAAELRVSSGATIDGALVINHSFVLGSGATMNFGSNTISMDRLIVAQSLFVLGDITIEGLATFISDVEIHGELIVSNKHAGYAMIPQSGTSVTVNFGTGFHATPVVTASPNVPVLYAVSNTTQTGFTLSLSAPAAQDIIFGWHALGSNTEQMTSMQLTVDDQLIFPVDTKRIPVSSNMAWNACIRNVTLLDETGQPLSCARYHDGYTWTHPDLMITFLWNTSMTPPLLQLPDGYEVMVTEDAATIEGAWADQEDANDAEESEDINEVLSSSSSSSIASFASSASFVSSESSSEATSSSESSESSIEAASSEASSEAISSASSEEASSASAQQSAEAASSSEDTSGESLIILQ